MELALNEIAKNLFLAEQHLDPIASPSLDHPEFSLKQAYDIQYSNVERQFAEGRRLVGYKFVLAGEQDLEGLQEDRIVFGHLFDHMHSWEHDAIDLSTLIQPQLSVSLAVTLKHDLQGSGLNVAEVLRAVDFILPAIEITDSRFCQKQPHPMDAIADNGGACLFTLGLCRQKVDALAAALGPIRVLENQKVVSLSSPLCSHHAWIKSLSCLSEALFEREMGMLEGQTILVGPLTPPLSVMEGKTYTAEFKSLGKVSVSFKDSRETL